MEENKLSVDQIVDDLNTTFIGQKVIHYTTLDSTMEAACREAQWGAPAGTVVISDEQTEGRGRLHRVWLSPQGSLALSVILRPNLDYLPNIIMLASLAVVFCIERVTALKPQIKWPNDILINEKKVAGILIQNDIHRSSLRHSIIGVGINVNMHMLSYPDILTPATSLSDELKKSVSRLQIVRQFLIELDKLYLELPEKETIFEHWKNRLITLGQYVRVTQEERIYFGIAESVARDGSLMLRQANGQLMKIVAGEVTLR